MNTCVRELFVVTNYIKKGDGHAGAGRRVRRN